jgi:hypothetical protein
MRSKLMSLADTTALAFIYTYVLEDYINQQMPQAYIPTFVYVRVAN